jgi:hypothetical protein
MKKYLIRTLTTDLLKLEGMEFVPDNFGHQAKYFDTHPNDPVRVLVVHDCPLRDQNYVTVRVLDSDTKMEPEWWGWCI